MFSTVSSVFSFLKSLDRVCILAKNSLVIVGLTSVISVSASEMTLSKWLEDIDEMVNNIEKYHPDPYHHFPKEKFYEEVALIKYSAKDSSSIHIQVQMMKLLSKLRDRHTSLHPVDPNGFNHWLPLYFYQFEDGFYVVSAIDDYSNLLGKKIISINGVAIEEIFELTADLHSSDNDFGRTQNTYFMTSIEVLLDLKIISDKKQISIQLKDDKGQTFSQKVTSIHIPFNNHESRSYGEMYGPTDQEHYPRYHMAYKNLNVKKWSRQPLSEKSSIPHFLRTRRGYWYDYQEDNNTMYVAICYSTNNGRHNFKSFKDFLHEVFSLIDNNPVDKFVLDIRFNPGGDGSMVLPLVHEIIKRDSINQTGKLFTLTGRKTYSAAQMIYAEMLKHTNTLLVGEPPGAPVNGYGDPQTYHLSNSGMQLEISSVYWQMGHPKNDSWHQVIDLPFVFKGADYVTGRDRALDFILELDHPYKSLPAILIESNIEEFQKVYQQRLNLFAKYDWWKSFDEREMRFAARDLFDQGEKSKSYMGFDALTQLYPQSWRAWRDYATRVLTTPDKEKARRLIEKGLAVNPVSTDLLRLKKKLEN